MRGLVGLSGGCLVWLCLAMPAAAQQRDLRLADAVKQRRPNEVAVLLKQKVDVNARQADGSTALHWAAYRDARDVAEMLIRAGATVDVSNDLDATPLSIAAENGSGGIVETLLKAGADANRRTNGVPPLMLASNAGSVDAVRALLQHKADVNATEPIGDQTALMWAIVEGHPDVARVLIEHGADVHARTKGGFTPLMFAAREEDGLESARVLVAGGARVGEASKDGSTPLLIATVRGQSSIVKFLLEQGANPNVDTTGYTPLHWVSGTWETTLSGGDNGVLVTWGEWGKAAGLPVVSRVALIKLLLAHGADVNARVKRSPPKFGVSSGGARLAGATPLIVASTTCAVPVIQVLLANGADRLLAAPNNMTPLLMAAGFGQNPSESRATRSACLEATKLFLDMGADIHEPNDAGDTPMHAAAYSANNSIVKFLLDRGARLNDRNKKGQTPMKLAMGTYIYGSTVNFHSNDETVALLRTLGGIE